MTKGNSGGLSEGKQPKNVGLWLTPVEMKSSVVAGIGGKAWCESCSKVEILCWLLTMEEPLRRKVSDTGPE